MRELIMLKYGEIALKGLNKSGFEQVLLKSVKHRLKKEGSFTVRHAQSTVYCEPNDPQIDMDRAYKRMETIFGISTITRAAVAPKDFEEMVKVTLEYLGDRLQMVRTFKVESKRSDKAFPMKTPEICMEMGGRILEAFPHLKVDVHNPQITVVVEVRDWGVYIHAGAEKAAGGMPVGSSGNAALLLSGGIDSPVAGYMMAKRGLRLTGIHFFSPPYTSERAKEKVITLAEKTTPYTGTIELYIVPFTEIQEEIKDRCKEEYFTVIMRRFMMKVASIIAEQNDCGALITGESLAQVASQTMKAIACTDEASTLPVFRPLIGMDKSEIIKISYEIDTFETSILPYEDCCTVFTPKHPKTKPVLAEIVKEEQKLDMDALIARAVEGTEKQIIMYE